jgi:nucleoid-associated protein YgaU
VAATTTKFAKAKLDLREPVAQGKKKPHFAAGSSIETLEFAFNPKDYSMSLQGGWNFKPQKKSLEPPEFTGTQPRSLEVEMFLDATDKDDGDVSKAVDVLLSAVRPTERSKSSGTPFPPIVVFSWGSAKPFVGVVKQVSATFTLFRPSGQPVRATCKISLQEYDPVPPRQNPTSGALRATRAHTVQLGDSLASIADREYGTPELWRAIATANELEDPFNLRVGRELLVPAPADASGMA